MVKAAKKADSIILAELAIHLWNDNTLSSLKADFEKLTEDDTSVCFIKYEDEKPIGFAQCQLRKDYVEGTETSPVGYLEGIFIFEEFRHLGYAKELLKCCEEWAKEKHCSEFASDCELVNDASLKFHIAMGFEEVNRIICFKKSI
ncbi:MAG: GNAT family N-acetyltransferase [Lachnospiraceae bacterium]|nr:GNAT family N-acetyltransferase [Lachnospiraceae bacterium]